MNPIRAVYEQGNLHLLDPVDLAEGEQVNVSIMRGDSQKTSARLSAREMLKLPVDERNRILAESAARAEESYRTDKDLTGFNAFGENDLYDETP